MARIRRALPLIVIWALVFGVLFSLIADWGRWDHFLINVLWRILIAALGGIAGLILNYFAGVWVGMGTNVIESMGVIRFSDDTDRKIENTFIFFCALVAGIIAWIFIK